MRVDENGARIPDPENAIVIPKGQKRTPKPFLYALRTHMGVKEMYRKQLELEVGGPLPKPWHGRIKGFWTSDGRYYVTKEDWKKSKRQANKAKRRQAVGKKPRHKIVRTSKGG